MRPSKFGNPLNIEDHVDMYGGYKPVRWEMGKREEPVIDAQDSWNYGELPYVETRTDDAFRSTLNPDDRRINDDREYGDHLEPFDRQVSYIGAQQIVTNAETEIPYPLPKASFKLRSRNAKNAQIQSQIASRDVEITSRGPNIKASEPRKPVTELSGTTGKEEPQVVIRTAVPLKPKLDSSGAVLKPNSGFDISFLISLGNSRLPQIEKVKKQVELRYHSQRDEAVVETRNHQVSSNRQNKQDPLRYPKSTKDIPTVFGGKPTEPNGHKVKKPEQARSVQVSTRDAQTIHQKPSSQGKHKTKKSLPHQAPVKSKEFDDLSVMGSSMASQLATVKPRAKNENTFGNISEQERRVEIAPRPTPSKLSKLSKLSKSSETRPTELSSKEIEEIHARVNHERNHEKKALHVSDRPSQTSVERPEIHSKTQRKDEKKQAKSTGNLKVQTSTKEHPEISTRAKSRNGKKQGKTSGNLKVQTSTKEHSEISYVKFDPSVKAMEQKKEGTQTPQKTEQEKTVEVAHKPNPTSNRVKTSAISATLEGEDNEKMDDSQFIPKGPRSRKEQEPLQVDVGFDTDKEIEKSKNILTFE